MRTASGSPSWGVGKPARSELRSARARERETQVGEKKAKMTASKLKSRPRRPLFFSFRTSFLILSFSPFFSSLFSSSFSSLSLLFLFLLLSLVRLRPVRAARHGGPHQLHRVLHRRSARGRRDVCRVCLPLGDRRVAPRDRQRRRHDRLEQPRVLPVERRPVGQAARQAGQRVNGERDLLGGGGPGARAEAAEVLERGGAGLVEALDLDLDVLAVGFVGFSIVSVGCLGYGFGAEEGGEMSRAVGTGRVKKSGEREGERRKRERESGEREKNTSTSERRGDPPPFPENLRVLTSPRASSPTSPPASPAPVRPHRRTPSTGRG